MFPAIEGTTEHTVTVAGRRVRYLEAGEGPPLILQHGWPQSSWAWRKVIGPLAADHRVICPDLPGFGGSDPLSGEKERLAAWLLEVMDALDVERAKLGAHDWGGFVGFLACLRAPERFSSLVALGTTHPWPPGGGGVPDPLAAVRIWYQFVLASPVAGRLLRRESVTRGLIARAGGGVWNDAEIAHYARALSDPRTADATVAIYRTFLTRELVPMIRGRYSRQRLTVPTQLIVGAKDPVITESAMAGWEAHAADMRSELVPGAAHWLPEECPELVVERLQAAAG